MRPGKRPGTPCMLSGMSDSELLKEIVARLGGLETRLGGLETRLGGLEQSHVELKDGQRRLERLVEGQQTWFQNLGQKVEVLAKTVEELRGEMATELGDMRELIESISDDNKIHRRAIANLTDQSDDHERRIKRLEPPPSP